MDTKEHSSRSFSGRACRVAILLGLVCIVGLRASVSAQQSLSDADRDRGRVMLKTIKDDLKKHYYDPGFHGLDLDAKFKEADEAIKQANSLARMFGIIAQTLILLDDSHTFFFPPGLANKSEYGWEMQMIGNKCYIVAVKPGSDAELKGIKAGDEILSIDGFRPTRETLWKVRYAYQLLQPAPAVQLDVIKPDGKRQQLQVLAKVKKGKPILDFTLDTNSSDIDDIIRQQESADRLRRHRYTELENGVFVWKMPGFDMVKNQVDDFADKFRKQKGLVLDLRGNAGGYEENLLRLLGYFVDHDLKIGDLKTRKEEKPLLVKTRGDRIFGGKLVVLIDSGSGSASELFARVIQLEKRGTVIGDVSAGAVMRSRQYGHELGVDVIIFYGASITDADIKMTDGKSLEHTGVTPDELKLPTGADLEAKRDPVLAYAISLLGVEITPEKAGSLFPVEWLK